MIITFYSYKGGVGRTQLVANLASYLCYYEEKKVLLIDWDLEAPGIDFYFKFDRKKVKYGLIDVFDDFVKGMRSGTIKDIKNIPSIFGKENKKTIHEVTTKGNGRIDLIGAGDYSVEYRRKVVDFDWYNFYETLQGKYYIEKVKEELNDKNYDYIFIDSRTGVSDYSAICNVQMPDFNVIVVAPSKQCFDGSKEIINAIINAPYVRSKPIEPHILPILSRIDEFINTRYKEWFREFNDCFKEYLKRFSDSINLKSRLIGEREITIEQFVDSTILPYKSDISYGETQLFSREIEKLTDGSIETQISNIAKYIGVLSLMIKEDVSIVQTHSVLGDNIARDKVINNHLYGSPDYLKLVDDIELDKKVLKRIPANEEEIRIKISEKITDSENKLERFKQDVYRLYEAFTKITVDTERLKQVKELFDKGSFREADAILNSEELQNELEYADRLTKENKIQKAQQIKDKVANEFLIKAQLWSTFYSELDWQSKSENYYEKALRASRDAIVLFNYALFLQNLNQLSRAQPFYQEALDQYRKLAKANLGAYLPDVAMTLNNLANLHSEQNEFGEALQKYEEALKIRRDLAKANPSAYLPYVAMILNNLAVLQEKKNEYGDALEKYEEALKIRRDLAKANPGTYLPDVADTLNNLAVLQKNKNEYGDALEKYEEALKIRRDLAKANPSTYLPDVATSLNNLANLHSEQNDFGEALQKYEEALKIRRDLAKANPGAYLPYVADTLNNLANLLSEQNDFGEALQKYEEALKIRRDLAKANPGAYLPYLADTLSNLAVLHSDQNEFGEALEKYEEALKIRRDLAIANPSTYLPDVAGTLNNLAVLQKENNEFGEAQEKYEEALKIRRDLAKANPSTYLPYVADTLNNLANLHSDKNEYQEALGKYEEALKIYRNLAKANPGAYLPDVAMTLNNLANLHSDKNEFGEALEKYEEALKIRRDLANANPGAYLPDVAVTLINLSIFYFHDVPDKDKSIQYAVECIMVAFPMRHIPMVEECIHKSFAVLKANGLNEELHQELRDKLSEVEQSLNNARISLTKNNTIQITEKGNKTYQNIQNSTITDNSVTQNHSRIRDIIKGNKIVIIDQSQHIQISEESLLKIKDSLLFLRIDRINNNNYSLKLELKTPFLTETIIVNKEIDLQQQLFNELSSFEDARKGSGERELTLRGYCHNIPSEHTIGTDIFNSFFVAEIGKTFEKFFSLLKKRKIDRLTLAISSDIPEVLNIPFELIKPELSQNFLSLGNDSFMIVHTTEADIKSFEMNTDPIAQPLKILFAASLPENTQGSKLIDLEAEEERVIEALGNLVPEQKIVIEFIEIASLDEIERALDKGGHNVVHISGHGVHSTKHCKGVLSLEDEEGNEVLVEGKELAEKLTKYSSIKLVVLSACQTARGEDFGVAGALIKEGIPAVLAMRYSVSDEAATLFTSKFYDGICKKKSFAGSLFSARKAVFDYIEIRKRDNQAVLSEWGTPFLYLNQNLNYLIDFEKKPENVEYFTKKPKNALVGGKYVGGGFVGRKRYLIDLTRHFRNKGKAVCMYGLGGIGKTTLAVRFAHNYDNQSYRIIQFEGEVTDQKILERFVAEAEYDISAEIANKLKDRINSPDFTPIKKLQFMIENYLRGRKIIIIFDNFEDNQKGEDKSVILKIASPGLHRFLAYLCSNLQESNYVVFTTRYCFDLPKVEFFQTKQMSFPDAYKIINRLDKLRSLSLKERKEVYNRLGGHPLALEQLDSLLTDDNSDWQTIKSQFDVVGDLLDTKGTERNRQILFENLLNKLDDSAVKVLKQAAVFRIARPVAHLRDILTDEASKIEEKLVYMDRLSLLYCDEKEFSVHRMTANFVLEKKTDESSCLALHRNAAHYYLNIKENERVNPITEYLEARYHLIEAKDYDEAIGLTKELDDLLTKRGFAELIFDMYDELLSLDIKESEYAFIKGNKALIYAFINQFSKAQPLLQEALQIYRNLDKANPGACLPNVATSLNNLANLHYKKNEFEEALEKYEEALKIRRDLAKANPGTYLPDVADTLNNLANLHSDKNEYKEALEKYEEALKIYRNLAKANPGAYLPNVAMTLNNLANLHSDKNEYGEALEKYEEALKIKRDLAKANPGAYLPNVATTLNNLAVLQKNKNEFGEALEKYEEALKIYRDLAEANPGAYLQDVAMTLNNLAILQMENNEFREAREKYEEALKIKRDLAKANPGVYLPVVADTLNNLANLHYKNNEFREAQEKYEEALKIRRDLAKANPGAFLPDVAMTLNNLAVLHHDKNEFGEALEKYDEALKIYRDLAEANPGAYLPDVAMTLNNLAVLHKNKNEFGEALEKYDEALKIYRDLAEANPGAYLPDVAMTLNNLAVLHHDKNEYGEALEKYEEALKIKRDLAKANPGAYLPDVAMTLNNLSIFYLQDVPDKDKSIQYAVECIMVAFPMRHIPMVEECIHKSIAVLKANGLNEEQIRNLLTAKDEDEKESESDNIQGDGK